MQIAQPRPAGMGRVPDVMTLREGAFRRSPIPRTLPCLDPRWPMRLFSLARFRLPSILRSRWRPIRKLAAALMRSGRFADADRVLADGLEAYPNHPELVVAHAFSAHESGRYGLAIARWETARRIVPHHPMCHAGLAANLRELGDLSRARTVIDGGLRRFPRHVGVVTEAARVAASEGRFEAAAAYWRRAASRRRPHPDWLQGYAQSLTLLGRFDEAQAVLARGRKRYPSHRGLCGVEGLLAVAREDWPAAIAHWRAYRCRFPDDPTGWEQLGIARQGEALARAETWAETRSATLTPAPVPALIEVIDDEPIRRLMLRFESLGDNCELGLVQRRYGAEPLGLLRWNTVAYDQLLSALTHRFDGMGEPAHTEIVLAANGEYFVQDRRWHLAMHTFLHAGQVDPDVLLDRMCRRVAFLRDKLVADLSAAEKIFVYRSAGLDEAQLAALHRALAAFGPNTLLTVQPAATRGLSPFRGTAGSVIEMADGCVVGFVRHLGVEEGQTTWNIAFDDWLAICRRAASAADKGRLHDDRLAS